MKKIFSLLFAVLVLTFVTSAQDAPHSVGPAPVQNLVQAPVVGDFDASIGKRYFSQISSSPTFQFGKAFTESCTITNIGAPFTITFPGGLMYRNGIVYTYNQSSPFQLWSIDTTTGTHTLVFNMTGVPQANFTGMVWDGTNVYGMSTSITQSQIFTINMTTGVCTPIGSASAVCAGGITLLGRTGAQYSLFALDIVADNLYKVNKTTGVFTLVGPLGANLNFGQDGSVDNSDFAFYAMDYSTGPELRKVDTATGTLGPVLCTYTAQATGMAILPPSAPPVTTFPDVLYYKFEQNASPTTTPNCALPPAGTNPATLTGLTLTTGGQFDSCLTGTGGTGMRVATGWNCDLASGNWTISFWVNNLVDMNPTYIFGDAGSTSFRCFYGGAAGVDNLLLRGPMTDILIPCPAGPQVFHMVYDGTNVIIYRNGALISTNPRTITMPTGTGFFVGGYTSGFGLSGKMDEFRLIRRALTPAEVTASWNSDLGGCGLVTVSENNNEIPANFSLSQNYPNPFNPVTNIKFSLPSSGMVKIVVFDLLGREVATLVNDEMSAGNYTVDFDASSLSSGVYFYRLDAGNFTQTKKMLLVK